MKQGNNRFSFGFNHVILIFANSIWIRERIIALNEPYKLEILDAIESDTISIYSIGKEWWDLCSGPHLENTGQLNPKAIDLLSMAGAYWRGSESNQMLQVYHFNWSLELIYKNTPIPYIDTREYMELHGKHKSSWASIKLFKRKLKREITVY